MTAPTKPETVWVMTFDLRNRGDFDDPIITLHRTYEGARASLASCVDQWWDDVMSDEEENPSDPDERIEAFFAMVDGTCNVEQMAILQ